MKKLRPQTIKQLTKVAASNGRHKSIPRSKGQLSHYALLFIKKTVRGV